MDGESRGDGVDELQQGDLQEPGEAEEKGAWMKGRLRGGGRKGV